MDSTLLLTGNGVGFGVDVGMNVVGISPVSVIIGMAVPFEAGISHPLIENNHIMAQLTMAKRCVFTTHLLCEHLMAGV